MTDQAIAVMAAFFVGWIVLVASYRRRLPADVLLRCSLALATLFFVLAAVGPRAADNELVLVVAGFAVLGAVMAVVVVLDARKR